jgi:CRP/FNR family transcriptional regulator, cyclic AMP receptor protein
MGMNNSGSLEDKRIFLIASSSSERAKNYSKIIQQHINNSQIFTCTDGADALFKMDNSPPHVFITEADLPKKSGIEVAAVLLSSVRFAHTSVIIASEIMDSQHFVDEVVTGRVQYLMDINSEEKLNQSVTKALNFLAAGQSHQYHLRFLASKETLFQEGDIAESVYIVRRGNLQAAKGPENNQKILGEILPGEFVGEMAHINGEPRSATVTALSDCELIEIPRGTIDTVLFSKPAWSKALVATLSKRLKSSNHARLKNEAK